MSDVVLTVVLYEPWERDWDDSAVATGSSLLQLSADTVLTTECNILSHPPSSSSPSHLHSHSSLPPSHLSSYLWAIQLCFTLLMFTVSLFILINIVCTCAVMCVCMYMYVGLHPGLLQPWPCRKYKGQQSEVLLPVSYCSWWALLTFQHGSERI